MSDYGALSLLPAVGFDRRLQKRVNKRLNGGNDVSCNRVSINQLPTPLSLKKESKVLELHPLNQYRSEN